jgi:RNase P protein component
MINKENPLNKQGRPSIVYANSKPEYQPSKVSKKAKQRNKIRRRIEDIQHVKEFEKLWGNL